MFSYYSRLTAQLPENTVVALSIEVLPRIACTTDIKSISKEVLHDYNDIFKAKIVVMPMNVNGFHLLVVLINPGGILEHTNCDYIGSIPMMLLLDPCDHSAWFNEKHLSRRICIFLNSMWELKHADTVRPPFTSKSFPCCKPKGNCIYVLIYVYNIYIVCLILTTTTYFSAKCDSYGW